MASNKHLLLLTVGIICAVVACKAEKPTEQKKPTPMVIVKPKPPALTQEQRKELKFPPELMEKLETAAGVTAEPFYATVLLKTKNLKGDEEFEGRKLSGFSVRTTKADELMGAMRASLRARGYLIFKSQKGYGSLPDILTVVKGNNSYDVLKIQGTESAHYRLDTKTIIAWLRARQREAPFVVTGAGPDWVEAQFTKPPKDVRTFAREVAAFAPDVLVRDTRTMDKLAEQMEKTNSFYLTWD